LLERPLGDDQFSRVREGDPVGVDIALSFWLFQLDSAVLI
jgi:hypothetical protein